jgi:hypothetical protein
MMARPAANSAHKHDSQCRPQFGGGQVSGPHLGRLLRRLDPRGPDGAVRAGSNVVAGAGRPLIGSAWVPRPKEGAK